MHTTKVVRREKFDLTLIVNDADFICTPTAGQKTWTVARALREVADDLEHADAIAKRFVPGADRPVIGRDWATVSAECDETQLTIDGQQVMHRWNKPYVEALALSVASTHGDVLEVGFGMGFSATYIQELGVASHTIIECNRAVGAAARAWAERHRDRDIRLVDGKWQDSIGQLGLFDGILFDTYPVSEEEYLRFVVDDVTFAHHFFAAAAEHLRPGGRLVYYSNEIDSVSRRHQRALFDHFREVRFSVCRQLAPPADCQVWWADSLVVATAVK